MQNTCQMCLNYSINVAKVLQEKLNITFKKILDQIIPKHLDDNPVQTFRRKWRTNNGKRPA